LAEESELKSGLTWRTFLALVAAIFLFIPVNIYSYFLTGIIQGSVAIFFITIIFSELSRLSGRGLSRAEILVLYYAAMWGGMSLPIYYNIIFRSYFVNSPFVEAYTIAGEPMKLYIPGWLVPPPGSPAHEMRTLFQPEFLTPLLVWFVWSILVLILGVSLSLVSAYTYVERLDYPFPRVLVDTSMTTFLADRPKDFAKYFLVSFGLGLGFGAIAYLPYSVGGAIIPIPYYDLTWLLEEFLPGSLFGVMTILSQYFTGLIVPFRHAFYMLASTIFVWVILNSLLVTTFPSLAPIWAAEYSKGMGLIAVWYRSYLRLWFAPQIGFMIAVAAFLIIFKTRRVIAGAFREVFALSSKGALGTRTMEGLPSMRTAIRLWLATSCLSVLYFYVFVPQVSLIVPVVYVFLVGLFIAVSLTAFQGETGFIPPGLPGWTWHSLVYLTPYQGYSGFIFQPALLDGQAPPLFSQQVKAASILKVKPKDLLIVWIAGSILASLCGLVSLDFFWRIAPIPSSAYPFTVYGALETAYIDAMIVSRQLNVSLETIGIPALILFVILVVGDLLYTRMGLFFSFIGIVMGLYWTPYQVLPLFVGALISRYVATRFFGGAENWSKIVGYVIAGELSGEGLMLMFNVILALVTKSAWLWPW